MDPLRTRPPAAPVTIPNDLSDRDFNALRELALEQTGIHLDDSKRTMLYARFTRRLRDLRLSTFADYIQEIRRPGSPELSEFINTVTTNLTYFFREEHHFEFLRTEALPALRQRAGAKALLRFWSAGCSSGEEPYSIAMTLNECRLKGAADYRLLATDLDTEMINRTRAGRFRMSSIRGLTDERRKLWFDQRDGQLVAKAPLREGLIIRQLNLFGSWPLQNPVDVIFCRNVLIYFTRDDQVRVIRQFSRHQLSGGLLFLGHSESIRGLDDLYERISNTVYRRL
ncbi:MAG: CheR family methyltransferase [Pseudomonadota bacterium]